MDSSKCRILAFVIVLCLGVASVWSDEIVTKDGKVYEGTVVSENATEVIIRIGSRDLTIAVKDIEKITYREEPGGKPVKLDVDLLETFYAQSLSITSGARGAGYGAGSSSGAGFISSSWVIWKGYSGFEKVNEPEFFRLAGRDDLAEKAEKYRKRATNWLIFGLAGFGGGIGMAVASELGEKPSVPLLIAGVVTANVGFWGGSIFGFLRLLRNGVDINTASGVARIYNEKLLKELDIDVPLNEIKPQF
ncbi:MAG: hypothetical protein E4H20_05280 [Spirochaetales bacterium]|nr:MAG: hypothetical protein E4H20_05280 [Spirochaetales bacterium]